MKFEMRTKDLDRIMRVCGSCVADMYHPGAYQMIKCDIAKGFITATSTDGYRIHETSAACRVIEGDDTSTVLLPPVKIPAHRGGTVTIECRGDEVTYDFGTVKSTLKIAEGEYCDTKQFWPTKDAVFNILINPRYLEAACKAFKGRDAIVLSVRGNKEIVELKSESIRTGIMPIIPKKTGD